MLQSRIFKSNDFIQPSDEEPIRSVVASSKDSTIIMWHVKPGQTIENHTHPNGQDTWTVLSGSAQYISDEKGSVSEVKTGDIVIAHRGEVHGAVNNGNIPFIFVSVVSPSEAGFELA